MNELSAYKAYMNLKLHFLNDDFDIRKGGIKSLKPNDKLKWPLQRLSKKYTTPQFIEYLVANFVVGDKYGGVFDSNGEKNYFDWQKRNQALSYTYKQDLLKLSDRENYLPNLWDSSLGHPLILKAYLGHIISIETFVILNRLYKFCELLDSELSGDPVWEDTAKLIRKYSPFIQIDKDYFKDITLEIFSGV